MTKPVLYAGLLGGLLGGVGGFALLRTFPTSARSAVQMAEPSHETRPFAEELIAKLRDGKYDEFFATVREGFKELNPEQFDAFRKEIIGMRERFAVDYGPPGDIEYSRESALSPSVVRYTFVAKYARGCVACFLVLYNTSEGWRVRAFSYKPLDAAFIVSR